ncbi:MAG: thiamine phosphate synthase [Clostridia bacterium]|nr:thiamine phosphate synthase [Clostridia bacterium]
MRFTKTPDALRKSMHLYAITDRKFLKEGQTLADQVREAIEGGATFIQIREKNISFDEYVRLSKEVKAVTDEYGVPFVVNDDVDVALACGADGAHVGQEDLDSGEARRKLGPNAILGVSASSVEELLAAVESGADYLGVGAIFPTGTKLDADPVTYEMLKKICEASTVPIVAIGGISKDNILKLKGSGIDGVAIVSAIFGADDIRKSAAELSRLTDEVTGK